MEFFSDFVAFMAGGPAIAGLMLIAPIIFLTSDWRLALSALGVQSVLVAITLSRFVQPEVVIVKVLVGLLIVPILYVSAREFDEGRDRPRRPASGRFGGLQAGWGAGPLGLPLRFLAFLLAGLALIRLFQSLRPTIVPGDVAMAACWLGGMGLIGLILSGEPLRVAPAALTIVSAFDLFYSGLEKDLGITGLFETLIVLSALAFSYLSVVHSLSRQQPGPEQDEEAGP